MARGISKQPCGQSGVNRDRPRWSSCILVEKILISMEPWTCELVKKPSCIQMKWTVKSRSHFYTSSFRLILTAPLSCCGIKIPGDWSHIGQSSRPDHLFPSWFTQLCIFFNWFIYYAVMAVCLTRLEFIGLVSCSVVMIYIILMT